MENKSGKIIVWIIVIAMFVLPFLGSLSSYDSEESTGPNDWVHITDMDYKAVVVDEPDSEGKIVVTERITFDIHAASRSNGFWELWRDLCEDTIDGLRVHYKVNSVKQIMPNGEVVVWEESDKLYWDDYDYVSYNPNYGPGKWYHSEGPYNEYRRQYECLMFYVDNVYREEMVFEVEYEMYNAAFRYNDCSELYVAMVSDGELNQLESFKGEFLIPDKDMPAEGDYRVTTYGTDNYSFEVEKSTTKNPGYTTFSFDLDEDDLKFSNWSNYLEFDIVTYGDSKHAFTDYAPDNIYSDDDVLDEIFEEQEYYLSAPARYKSIKTTIFICCGVLATLIALLGFTKPKRFKKKYQIDDNKYEKETFRDIPSDLDPKFAAALVKCKDKKPEDDAGVYSALLLSLARKGYIKLQDIPSGDVLIFLNDEDPTKGLDNTTSTYESILSYTQFDAGEQFNILHDTDKATPLRTFTWDNEPVVQTETDRPVGSREPLTWSEAQYLSLIKRHADKSISMEILQAKVLNDYDFTAKFADNVKKATVNYGIGMKYFQKANYKEPAKKMSSSATTHFVFGAIFLLINLLIMSTQIGLAFGAFIMLGLVTILTGLYIKSQSHKFALLTELGDTEYRKWRGLYNFLNSDTLIKEKTVVELPLWEKYLVYATAFGISEKVIEAIKIRCPLIDTTESIVYHSYCRTGRIRVSGTRFHHSVRSGHRTASFHSSSGGGRSYGGYGGGGRGGGFGGGGH